MDPDGDAEQTGRRTSALIWLAVAVGVVGLLWLFIATRDPDQDKLKDSQLSHSAPSVDPEKRCSDQATYDLIKRELFRNAARLRGGDPTAFDGVESSAALRVEDPAMESQDRATGAINCSGSISVDLPSGFAVTGGQAVLTGDVDYRIQPAVGGNGNDAVQLHNADGIITALARMTQTAQEQTLPAAPDDANSNQAESNGPVQPPTSGQQPLAQTSAAPAGADCSSARTRGDAAVCADPGLAALDRAMTSQYRRALSVADPDQQALLRSTAARFIAYRDHCPDTTCMSDAYTGRVQEIRDIIDGRWQPPR